MAKAYVTGPALIYVGVPVQFSSTLTGSIRPSPTELRAQNDPGFNGQQANLIANQAGPRIDEARAANNELLEILAGGDRNKLDLFRQGARNVDEALGLFNQPPQAPVNERQAGGRLDNNEVQAAAPILTRHVPIFLGTAEASPDIDIKPNWLPVHRNDAGIQTPFDMIYDGESGLVVADLNRYNEAVYAHIASRAASATKNIRGASFTDEVGTMMVSEGRAYPLWVVFPYARKPAYSDMPPGYRFFASILLGPDRLSPLGTRPRKVRLVWYGLRIYNQTTGTFILYDHDISGLPSPN